VTTPAFELYRLDRDLTREQLITELAATPDRVRALIAGRSSDDLQRRPSPDDWSPIEICRHIRDALQVYGMRFKWMILQDDPLLPNYEEDRWVAHHPDSPAELDTLVTEMAAYRAETVRLLRSLTPDSWSRPGHHEALGPLTLEPYVRHQLAHEEQHLSQLRGALSTR
jgi:hypothetical protein